MTKEKLYNYLKDKSVSEMYKDLKSWDIPHGLIKNKWYSIVGGGKGLYGDGVTTFEVWTEKMESEGLGPFGYSTPEEVEKILLWLI
jgi:hypothetical protein